MLISIHQPETYPQLTFFEKIQRSNLFVVLDDVQFRKNYFQNRNTITDRNGKLHYLTIPVIKKTELIFEKQITDEDIASKHLSKIRSLKKNARYIDELDEFFSLSRRHRFLSQYNMEFIKWVCGKLNINTSFIQSQSLHIGSKGSDRILNICQACAADKYYSGMSGLDYLTTSDFEHADIEIVIQNVDFVYSEIEKLGLNRHSSMIDLIADLGIDQIRNILEKYK